MNKVILGLILAVCILGMALVMLNERLGRKNDYSPPPMAESGFSQDTSVVPEKVDIPTPTETYKSSREIAENVIAREREQAREALAPPVIQEAMPGERMTTEQEREALKLAAGVQLASEAETPVIPPAAAKPAESAQKPAAKPAQPKPAPEQPAKPKPAVEQPQKPKPVAEQPAKPKEQLEKKDQPEKAAKPKAAQDAPEKATARPEPAKPAAANAASHDIKRFVVYARENGATVRVTGNGAMAWRSMILDNPPRVVLDLDGQWKFPPNPGIPKNDLVTNVRIGKSSDNRTRVVIDLKEKPKSARVIGAKDGDGFDVRVDK